MREFSFFAVGMLVGGWLMNSRASKKQLEQELQRERGRQDAYQNAHRS